MGGLVLIWVLQEWASSIHSYKDSLITPWNPGIGILFAVIIREGVLYGLALFVGVVCAEFVTRGGALGLPVTRLIRVAYGPFQLGNLPRGAVEEVNGKILREQVPGLGK